MLVVVDYNVGNVRSVCNTLQHIGCEAKLSSKAGDIEKADGIILPGVAAFGYAAAQLGGLGEAIREAASAGKGLLGICVGYQLLFDESQEHGLHKGLGLIGGAVVPVPAGLTIPHMGWNEVDFPVGMGLFAGLAEKESFYFAHSYYADIRDSAVSVAYTHYGADLPAAVEKGNIYGVQFHPEKSGQAGLDVLKNFERICNRRVK